MPSDWDVPWLVLIDDDEARPVPSACELECPLPAVRLVVTCSPPTTADLPVPDEEESLRLKLWFSESVSLCDEDVCWLTLRLVVAVSVTDWAWLCDSVTC
jgi:hypothetical protein